MRAVGPVSYTHLLNMIAGVYPLDSGTIELDGEDISRLSEPKRAKYLGRVFQDPMRLSLIHISGARHTAQVAGVGELVEVDAAVSRARRVGCRGQVDARGELIAPIVLSHRVTFLVRFLAIILPEGHARHTC